MPKIVPTGIEIGGTIYSLSSVALTTQAVAAQDDEQSNQLRKAQGAHKIRRMRSIVKDWKQIDQATQRHLRQVTNIVEQQISGIPDFDSGYFKVETGFKVYTLDHGLGSVPTRYCIFFTTESKAPSDSDLLFVVAPTFDYYDPDGAGEYYSSGFQLFHQADGAKSFIQTGEHYLYTQTYTSGNIRVLLWR